MNEMFQRLQLLLAEAAKAIADPDTGIRDERKAAQLTLRLLEAGKELGELQAEASVAEAIELVPNSSEDYAKAAIAILIKLGWRPARS